MKPSEIITITCKVLELDVDILIHPRSPNPLRKYPIDSSRHVQKYCDARYIIAYLIRKHHDKDYSYRAIAKMLGHILKNGDGDHSAAIYAEWACGEKLKHKFRERLFIEKFEKVKKATSL